jgi:hypothetical protein
MVYLYTESAGLRLSFLSVFKQLSDAISWLSAFAHPVFNTLQIYTQTLFLATSNWVEETHTLDKATVARVARVSNIDAVKRAFFRATTGQTNNYHKKDLLRSFYQAGTSGAADQSTASEHPGGGF